MERSSAPEMPSLKEAVRFWLRLGLISFGGPAGQIAIMHDFLVEKKRWISNGKFLHALNYCMLLPGPEAQQLATYTGWLLHGVRGGLAAGILFVLPSTVILWALSVLYVNYGQIPAIQAVFEFLKPAVVAVVAGAMVNIGKKALRKPVHYVVASAAFVAIYWLKVPFPAIILVALLTGILSFFFAKTSNQVIDDTKTMDQEDTYLLNLHSNVPLAGKFIKPLLRQFGVAILLWLLPLLFLLAFAPDFLFWQNLCLFFSKAAFVTFGGAYAILPYVSQVSVDQFHWLSRSEMLDGLALGETTPGPLIIVLAFVGFMGSYHHFGASFFAASAGLALTVWYTFLPSFLFIFAGAPFIERSQSKPALKSVLEYTSAAICGVILSLCLYLASTLFEVRNPVFPYLSFAWALISLLALQVCRINLMGWIGISIILGLAKYYIMLI